MQDNEIDISTPEGQARAASIQQAQRDAIRRAVVADFTRNGGQVSAITLNFPDGKSVPLPGASLLDEFAGQALVGIMGSYRMGQIQTPEEIATLSFVMAAAMLKERQKYTEKKDATDAPAAS